MILCAHRTHMSCNHDLPFLLSAAVYCSTSTQQLCSLPKCTLTACCIYTLCVLTCHGTIVLFSVCMTSVGIESLAQIVVCDNVGS